MSGEIQLDSLITHLNFWVSKVKVFSILKMVTVDMFNMSITLFMDT